MRNAIWKGCYFEDETERAYFIQFGYWAFHLGDGCDGLRIIIKSYL